MRDRSAMGFQNDGPLNGKNFYNGNVNQWPDFYTFANAQWLGPASTPPVAYYYPGSPTDRCANVLGVPNACPLNGHGVQQLSLIPANYRDGRWDTASIAKVQYQKNFGSTAYVRLFGYTFYSNTNRASANGCGNNVSLGVTNYQYEVDSHTSGLEMQFADQISSQHLLEGMVSYLASNTLRYFNHNYNNTSGQQVSNFTNGSDCYATANSPRYRLGYPAPCNKYDLAGSVSAVRTDHSEQPRSVRGRRGAVRHAGVPRRRVDAVDISRQHGRRQCRRAAAHERFARATSGARATHGRSMSAVRFENDAYDLADTNNPATNFWFAAAQKEFCVNPVTRQPIFKPQPPQSIYLYTPYVSFNCPVDNSTGTAGADRASQRYRRDPPHQ